MTTQINETLINTIIYNHLQEILNTIDAINDNKLKEDFNKQIKYIKYISYDNTKVIFNPQPTNLNIQPPQPVPPILTIIEILNVIIRELNNDRDKINKIIPAIITYLRNNINKYNITGLMAIVSQQKGGSYEDKYIKYKTKYLELKKLKELNKI